MTTDEIKTNEIIAEAIDKLIEKYQKKADKETARLNRGLTHIHRCLTV